MSANDWFTLIPIYKDFLLPVPGEVRARQVSDECLTRYATSQDALYKRLYVMCELMLVFSDQIRVHIRKSRKFKINTFDKTKRWLIPPKDDDGAGVRQISKTGWRRPPRDPDGLDTFNAHNAPLHNTTSEKRIVIRQDTFRDLYKEKGRGRSAGVAHGLRMLDSWKRIEGLGRQQTRNTSPARMEWSCLQLSLYNKRLNFDSPGYRIFRENFLEEFSRYLQSRTHRIAIRQWTRNRLKTAKHDYRTLLRFDAERSWRLVQDEVHRRIYREIRRRKYGLTKAQKRAYLLAWCMCYKRLGQPLSMPWGFQFSSFPVFYDFWRGDAANKELILQGLMNKRSESRDTLNWRWLRYLQFRPFWLQVRRSDDQEHMSGRREYHRGVRFRDVTQLEDPSSRLDLEAIENNRTMSPQDHPLSENARWDNRFSSASWSRRQKKAIQLLARGTTQKEVARRLRITPQAVSKMVKRALGGRTWRAIKKTSKII